MWEGEFLFPWAESALPDGRALLRVKVRDLFNFVDHPEVTLDAAGGGLTVSLRLPGLLDELSVLRPLRGIGACVCGKRTAILVAALTEQVESEKAAQPANGLAVEETGLSRLTALSYAFCNSGKDLYPGIPEEKRRIPLKRFIQAFGDYARATMHYKYMGVWGGSPASGTQMRSALRQRHYKSEYPVH